MELFNIYLTIILYTEEYDTTTTVRHDNDKAAYSSVQGLVVLPFLPRDKRTVAELYKTIDRFIFVTPKNTRAKQHVAMKQTHSLNVTTFPLPEINHLLCMTICCSWVSLTHKSMSRSKKVRNILMHKKFNFKPISTIF